MDDVKVYTWKEFSDAVKALLPIDTARLDPIPSLIALWIRLGVIELQNLIGAYRAGHETIFLASDFVLEGYACRATLPPQAKVMDAYLVQFEQGCTTHKTRGNWCQRFPLKDIGWAKRMDLVHNRVATNGGQAFMAFDPQAYTFYVYPGIKDCQVVSLFWEGLKIEFQDEEQTPFDEQMTLVVADYCKRRISREIDKDLPLAADFQQSYMDGRSLLYLAKKEQGQTNL